MGKIIRKGRAQSQNTDVLFSIDSITMNKEFITFPPGVNFDDTKSMFYTFEVDVQVKHDLSIIKIIVSYEFLSNKTSILDLQIENDFKVLNLSKVITKGEINNQEFLVFLIGATLGHLRGVQSTLIKDTPISKYFIPFINEKQILSNIKKRKAVEVA